MRDLAQKFRRVSFFLQRITVVGRADDFDLFCNQFPTLTFALGRNQFPVNGDGRASR